jgi:hypothetical protein
MSQWWGETPKSSPEAYQIARKVGQRAFTGSHPKAMRSRISSSFDLCDPGKGSLRLDLTEVKDAITLAWESIFPYRIGEFRNYELV